MKYLTAILFLFSAVFSNLHAKENTMTKENPIVCLETNQGVIEIKLFPKVAPKTCENFLIKVL